MVWQFLIQIAIAVALAVLSYVLAPRPRTQKPAESRDLDNPTAEAGRPIPVVFGTVTIKGLNVIHYADKAKRDYEVNA